MKGLAPWGDGSSFRSDLGAQMQASPLNSVRDCERVLLDAARKNGDGLCAGRRHFDDAWASPNFLDLLGRRRDNHDQHQRKELSKDIRRYVRQELRKRRSKRAQQISTEFVDLGRVGDARRLLVVQARPTDADELRPEDFASFLATVFATDMPFQHEASASLSEAVRMHAGPGMEPFNMGELRHALKCLTN